MSITYVLEVFFFLNALFLKSHCKLAHLSGIFTILRFVLAFPVQPSFRIFEQPSP